MSRPFQSDKSISVALPEIHFENFPEHSSYAKWTSSVFVPLHYEKGYAYPLVVWLPGSKSINRQLTTVMPQVSLRNYVAISPDLAPESQKENNQIGLAMGDKGNQNLIFHEIERVQRRYHIDPERVFIAGCGSGGYRAMELAMKHPESFAGAISLCGSLPTSPLCMGDVRRTRQLPVFLGQSRQDTAFSEEQFCDGLRMLHVAGFSVTARQYPGGEQINTQMLHDIDVWIMELINGFDMTNPASSSPERN